MLPARTYEPTPCEVGERHFFCLHVYIAFDQDQNQAGQNAAHALLHGLDRAGLHVRLVDLPAGQDPT